MEKIVPFLWFDNNAEEAVAFYISVFKNSKIVSVTRCGDAGPGPKGSVLTIVFQLEGRDFYALNGGPMYKFSPAISLYVDCETQDEVDELWDKLTAEGEPVQCGWLTDKFGVTWQVIPKGLGEMLSDKDATKVQRATAAMMKMKKIDIAKMKAAFDGN